MRIYIIGPMTGVEDLNRPAFDAARARLSDAGYVPDIPHLHTVRDDSWMRAERTCTRKTMRGAEVMNLYMCSRCGAAMAGYLDAHAKHPPRYCPSCGAKVVGR